MAGIQQTRQQERHEQKLQEIKEQVAKGTLVIRQMTDAERKRYPPLPARPDRRGGKRR